MDKKILNFRSAKVYKKRDFFCIIFYWRSDFESQFKRYKKTFGLIRIEDLKTRTLAANVMCDTINEALKDGWNPEADTFTTKERKGQKQNGKFPLEKIL